MRAKLTNFSGSAGYVYGTGDTFTTQTGMISLVFSCFSPVKPHISLAFGGSRLSLFVLSIHGLSVMCFSGSKPGSPGEHKNSS